uniref:IS66 family transposase n=1 Tax=Pseudonocardia sp. H11422 TaxID=2835866 RepID=UPI00292D9DAB
AVSGSEPLSREELLALIESQARVIEELTARIATQDQRIVELERRLGRNSGNSSQPPSADGPAVPPSRSPRRRSGRRPGKQTGAGGSALFQISDPDEVVDYVPDACRGCGHDLADAAGAGVVRRQVHDIPTISPVVVEHRLHRRRCGCGTTTTAAAPAGVGAAVCYGPNLRALAVYLLVFQHIPVARTQALIADLTGARPSTGWIGSVLSTVAEVLVDVEKLIKSLIVLAHVIHVDETSSNINGARWWLHVAGTETLTAYHLHPSRGRVAVAEFDVLPAFRGTVVHDALSVYDAYPGARHALCGAHLARELVAAAEAHPEQAWPEQALRALHGLNTAAHAARDQQQPAIPPEIADPLLDSWRHALLVGLAEHRRAPGRKQSKTRNLLERLRDRDDQVLLFARDLSVPFTNNQAERDVRPTKTQLKISGCHRSATTAKAWLRIRSYISTVRKHGDNVLDALRDAITGSPWKPPLTC